MKNCGEIIELISLYIDNELDNESRNDIEEHIETCESCRSELESLREIVGVLGSIEDVELPSGFKENLHERLMAQKNDNGLNSKIVLFKKKPFGFVSSVAAGLILVVVAGSLIMTRGLYGNVAKDGHQMLMNTHESESAKLALDGDKQSDESEGLDNLENYSIMFDEADESSKSRKVDGIGEAGESKEMQEFPDNAICSIAPTVTIEPSEVTAPSSEEPQVSCITVAGLGIYDVHIIVNAPDVEKEIGKINDIASSCNILLKDKIIATFSQGDSSAVSSPDETKKDEKVLNFNMDNSKYTCFIDELKAEYGDNLSFDDKFDGDGTMKRLIITVEE